MSACNSLKENVKWPKIAIYSKISILNVFPCTLRSPTNQSTFNIDTNGIINVIPKKLARASTLQSQMTKPSKNYIKEWLLKPKDTNKKIKLLERRCKPRMVIKDTFTTWRAFEWWENQRQGQFWGQEHNWRKAQEVTKWLEAIITQRLSNTKPSKRNWIV